MATDEYLHVAVDVGGTFTDICVFDRRTGELRVAKTPSTPEDLTTGILAALSAAEVEPQRIALIVHGTTIATNALITRQLPPSAMITTEGFRDVIEIRRGTRNELYDPYDHDVAPPYIRRRDRFIVPERTDARGTILRRLDESEARRVAGILRRRGVSSVAICFINSFANPANEQRMKAILQEEIPGVSISVSSEILPEIFEHERFSTTVVNAVLSPVVGQYVSDLDRRLDESGSTGDLLLLHSAGGVMTPDSSTRFAARLASSGTAAGAIAVRHIGALCDAPNVIGLDMGGTSADLSLVYGGELRMTRDWSVEFGYPIRFPSIELLTIGAGGGSYAWIDAGGALRNGPQSAGAEPGPACYGRGGAAPTNTDANLALGRLGTELVGGGVRLDREAAIAAVRGDIGTALGLGVEESANAIIRVANANMADAIRRISIGRGYDPRDFAIVAFGGAGPLHAAAIARDLAIPRVIVPPNPGVASALGCLLVDIRHDLTRMYLASVDDLNEAALSAAFMELEAEARELLAAEGVSDDAITVHRSADMRYAGQWRSITVPFAQGDDSVTQAVRCFHEEYEREHNYRRDDAPVEIYQVHVTAIGTTPTIDPQSWPLDPRDCQPKDVRRVVFDDGTIVQETPVYARETLTAGSTFTGPAIVEQLDSTTVVPPGVGVTVDRWHNLRMTL